MMNALLDSGLIITAAWPIDTELKSRMRALDSATLTSSIYVVARKRKREPLGPLSRCKKRVRGVS